MNIVEHAQAVVAAAKKLENLKEAALIAKDGTSGRLELWGHFGGRQRSQSIDLTRDESLRIVRSRLRSAKAALKELSLG
jgi:hypothetical protein